MRAFLGVEQWNQCHGQIHAEHVQLHGLHARAVGFVQHMFHHQRGACHDHGHGAAHGESQGDAEQKARAAQKLKQADLLRRTNGLPRASDLLVCREHRHRRQSEYAEDAYDEIGACVVDGEQSLGPRRQQRADDRGDDAGGQYHGHGPVLFIGVEIGRRVTVVVGGRLIDADRERADAQKREIVEPYRAERADSAAYGDDRPSLEHMLVPDAGDEAIDEGIGEHRPQRNQGDRYRRHPRERGQLTAHERSDR